MSQKTTKILIQKLKNLFWHLPKAYFYNLYYSRPTTKLTLIGITGTDGKTTTVSLTHKALIESGINAGMISTIGAKIGEHEISVGLHTTSPDPKIIQNIFRQMVDQGVTHAVVEVTAHALDQYRFFGCHFKIGAITNTSHEHLDDFQDMKSYIKTKSILFQNSDVSILNKDDDSFDTINQIINSKIISYSVKKPSDHKVTEVSLTPKSLSFKLDKIPYVTDSNYFHQIYNITLVHLILSQLNIDPQLLPRLVKTFPLMKGRREIVDNDFRLKCLVDFAHTPAALEDTLRSLKTTSKGKLIVIFGATGGRDSSKRPLMGEVVSEIADIAIITADDTRNEKVEDINEQIISGIKQSRIAKKLFSFYNIPKRQDAFNLAVKLASPGDTIIACGKGHETTILHGKTEYPWSEREAFMTAFRINNL